MGLFDENEEISEDDKIRLFETHQKSKKSFRDYARFLPILILVIIAIAAALYFSLPSVGDQVKAPKELEDQVYDYMLTKEKRTASEMTFYKCDGYSWVKVMAEPRSYPPSNLLDAVNQYRLMAEKHPVDGSYKITTVDRMEVKGDDMPCRVKIDYGND